MLFYGSKNSEFSVSVDDGLVTHEVFSNKATTDWSHAWADMSPWAGQPVTVTFSLEQSANEPLVKVYLDDITLGSWLTPVVTQAEPAVVEKWTTAYITLSGKNFIQTPTVKLNSIQATGVEWQDENHIRFQLPPGLPVGIYNITVSNPGGQPAVCPAGCSWDT